VHPLQEQARFGALDDAVVVGAGDRDDLGDAERREVAPVGTFELGRVLDAADADDHALAGHQPGHRLHRADRAGVGEGDVGTGVVVDGELVLLDLADQLFVGGQEAGEVERVGVLDDGHHEGARAVALVDVDGEAHVDVIVAKDARLAVGALDVSVLHVGDGLGDRLHDGVPDQVGEADLAEPRAGAVSVDHLAVDLEQLGGDVAEAGGGGNLEAGLHVLHDHGADALDRLADLWNRRRSRHRGRRDRGRGGRRLDGLDKRHRLGGRRGGRGRWRCGRRRLCAGLRAGLTARSVGDRAVVLEELAPRLADRIGVGPVLLEHLLDEPRVGAERRGVGIGWHRGRSYCSTHSSHPHPPHGDQARFKNRPHPVVIVCHDGGDGSAGRRRPWRDRRSGR
jgi:hypothetical protein